MDNYSKIYWITRLDNIISLCIMAISMAAVGLVFYYVFRHIDNYDDEDIKEYDKTHKTARLLLWLTVFISTTVLTFIPSKNDLILIYAGGKTMDFVEADSSLSKIPSQTTLIISEYLDDKLKEMEKEENLP